MSDEPENSPDSPEPKLTGLQQIKTDGESLFKLDADGNIILTIHIRDIKELDRAHRIAVKEIMSMLVMAAMSVGAFTWLPIRWIKWPVGVIMALLACGAAANIKDNFILVQTRDGDIRMDLREIDEESDVDGFLVQIRSAIRDTQKVTRTR